MQSWLERISHWLAGLGRIIAGLALAGLMSVTIADVATRYLYRLTEGGFALRVTGSVELVSYLMLFALLAAMAANVEKSQVVVEAFSHRLADGIKTRLHGFYLLGFAALGVVLCIGLIGAAAGAARHGEVTQDLRISMSPIYYTAAALSLLLGVRSFIHAVLSAVYVVPAEVSHGE